MPKLHKIEKANKCPYCGSKIIRKTGDQHFKNNGHEGLKLLVCENTDGCGASTMCDEHWEPYGTLAREPLRRLRQRVHQLIDPLYKNGYYSRTTIYRLMADHLKIPREKCHVGLFDIQQCNQAIEFYQKLRNYPVRKELTYDHATGS